MKPRPRVETGSVIPQTSIVAVSFDWIHWKLPQTSVDEQVLYWKRDITNQF